MKKIIIYYSLLVFHDGIYTWIKNFCNLLQDNYDITILTKEFNPKLKYGFDIPIVIYDPKEIYTCDVFLKMYDFTEIPNNIISVNEFSIIHCNYESVKEDININDNFIAVSEIAANGFNKRFGKEINYVESFIPNYKPNKVLNLISCSRIRSFKGIQRMYQLAQILTENNIRYRWFNYTDLDHKSVLTLKDIPVNIINHLPSIPHETLLDYIADSDYFVQLSDHEGYCYGVHESLSVGTPVICTDIPIFKEIITNGYNGYRLKLDMTDVPIKRIAYHIPKDFMYEDDINKIKSKWVEILG